MRILRQRALPPARGIPAAGPGGRARRAAPPAGRNGLAGDQMTYADLAAAAHLSCADYLGDVPWDEDETAKDWYARVKSRPAFRTLLADRMPGMPPPSHSAALPFYTARA